MNIKEYLIPVKNYFLQLQDTLTKNLESLEQGVFFHQDEWQRDAGGGGRTRVLQKGEVFEQAGVNFSHVHGDSLPPSATLQRPQLANSCFDALGVSLVVHPNNPYVPTTHLNVRFFIAKNPDGEAVWWFGGGYDLTPYYGFVEDCQHWHRVAKNACDPFGDNFYRNFKKWADDYFFIKHRQEHRGIGGLFFDDFNELGFERSFAFVQSVGNSFLDAYLPIVEKRRNTPYSQEQKDFQLYRRGRYVEFNLVYDRGTLFGLQSGGRTESILMSLPPQVQWRYNWQSLPNSPEDRLYKEFIIPREWV